MYTLYEKQNGNLWEFGRFDTVQDAAKYIYNRYSDRNERIADAWESGSYDDCFRGDFSLEYE